MCYALESKHGNRYALSICLAYSSFEWGIRVSYLIPVFTQRMRTSGFHQEYQPNNEILSVSLTSLQWRISCGRHSVKIAWTTCDISFELKPGWFTSRTKTCGVNVKEL